MWVLHSNCLKENNTIIIKKHFADGKLLNLLNLTLLPTEIDLISKFFAGLISTLSHKTPADYLTPLEFKMVNFMLV